jgi:hypothetical protein
MGRQAHRDRLVLGPDGADGAEQFERIAGAVLMVAAIVVVAPVGERRQEARQKIAVGGMQFQNIEPEVAG